MEIVLTNKDGCVLDTIEIDSEYPSLRQLALKKDWVLMPGDRIIVRQKGEK